MRARPRPRTSPGSRRPHVTPNATPAQVAELVLRLHKELTAALYDTMPKALPGPSRDAETHDRIRHDIVDQSGTVTLRIHSQLRHIGIGRTHKGTHVIPLIQDLDVRVVNAITGELLRDLTIDPSKEYQPRTPK